MKLSPIDIYGIILPENAPIDILYYYAKVLGKTENRSRTSTFEKVIDWCIEAVEIPDDINQWSTRDFSLFARFLNPEVLEWKKSSLVTAWNFIRDILSSGLAFNNQLSFGFPTPNKPKSISPLLVYSICSRIRPTIHMRGKTVEELFPVARAILFSGSVSGLLDTFQQIISLSLVTSSDIDPITTLVRQFDETTALITKNVKRRMNISERFSFVRTHLNDDIQDRIDSGFYSLENPIFIPSIEPEPENRGVNRFSFYGEEVDENSDFFQSQTSLPFLAMSLIGKNLSEFEFGNHYAICLRNNQIYPNDEIGRESICAIVRAAYYHNRDITDAENPENVLEEEMEEYPLLNEDFNSAIPPKAYPLYVLKELAFNDGLIDSIDMTCDEYELHEMLQVNMLNPKFWLGKCFPNTNDKTIYLEDVNDIENPISYGVKGGNYYIFDPVELSLYLNHTGILQNPAAEKMEYFSPSAIRQLLHMVSDSPIESDYGTLRKAVENIIEKIGSLEMKLQEFYTLYKASLDDGKIKAQQIIYALHKIGMSMRGWLPNHKLPIIEASVGEKDYNKVEEQVNKVIGEFMSLCDELQVVDPKLKNCVMDMPIWKYKTTSDNKGYFVRPNHESDTINKRLQLVLKGELTGQDENSCIRVSSNYFCGTSYRLAKILQIDLGYNITDLREIS